jgi:hypothetical protein
VAAPPRKRGCGCGSCLLGCGCLSLLLLVLAAIAAGVWFWPQLRERLPSESRVAAPFDWRPEATVTHPSGARVSYPAGPYLFSTKLRLVDEPRPQGLGEAKPLAPVLRFESAAGVVSPGRAEVDLPVAGDPAGASVVVQTALGLWVPLPSERVQLADGRPGLRVRIDSQPAPWLLTIVRDGPGTSEADADARRLLRLEQLLWTDKDAFERALAQPAAAPAAGLFDLPVALAAPRPRPTPAPWQATKHVREAAESFYRAGAAQRLNGRAGAFGHWVDGLRSLAKARAVPRYWTEKFWLGDQRWPEKLPQAEPLSVAIEMLLSRYAPWGLELTLKLVEQGLLTGETFQLEVLEPIGESPFCDVPVEGPGMATRASGPWQARLARLAREHGLAGSQQRVVLRFYGRKGIEQTWLHWALEGSKDTVLRYGPVVLGFYTGGLSGAALPATFAALDYVLGKMEEEFPSSPVTYATVEFGQMGAGAAADSVVVALMESELKAAGNAAALGRLATTGRLSRGLLVADAAVTAALVYYKWDGPNAAREISERSPLGYREGEEATQLRVPPIVFIGWVEGDYPRPRGDAQYGVMGRFNTLWLLDYNAIYRRTSDGLGFAHFVRREDGDDTYGSELAGPLSNREKTLPWRDMVNELDEGHYLPSAPRFSAEPREQFIAFELPQPVVESAAAAAGVSGAWTEVDLDALGLEVLVEGKGPEEVLRATLPLVEAVEPKSKTGRRALVHLHVEGFVPTEDDALEPPLRGPAAELPQLLARYTLSVRAREGDEPRRIFWSREVDFRREKSARRGVAQREGSWWWGGGKEPVPWHSVNLGSEPGEVPLPELLLPRTGLPLGLAEKERDEEVNRDPVGFGETATQTLITPPKERPAPTGEFLDCLIPPMSGYDPEREERCKRLAEEGAKQPPREKELWIRVGLARTFLPGPRALTNRVLFEGMRFFYVREFGTLVEQRDGSFRSAEGTKYRSIVQMSGNEFVAVYTESDNASFDDLETVRTALLGHMNARRAAAAASLR